MMSAAVTPLLSPPSNKLLLNEGASYTPTGTPAQGCNEKLQPVVPKFHRSSYYTPVPPTLPPPLAPKPSRASCASLSYQQYSDLTQLISTSIDEIAASNKKIGEKLNNLYYPIRNIGNATQFIEYHDTVDVHVPRQFDPLAAMVKSSSETILVGVTLGLIGGVFYPSVTACIVGLTGVKWASVWAASIIYIGSPALRDVYKERNLRYATVWNVHHTFIDKVTEFSGIAMGALGWTLPTLGVAATALGVTQQLVPALATVPSLWGILGIASLPYHAPLVSVYLGAIGLTALYYSGKQMHTQLNDEDASGVVLTALGAVGRAIRGTARMLNPVLWFRWLKASNNTGTAPNCTQNPNNMLSIDEVV